MCGCLKKTKALLVKYPVIVGENSSLFLHAWLAKLRTKPILGQTGGFVTMFTCLDVQLVRLIKVDSLPFPSNNHREFVVVFYPLW